MQTELASHLATLADAYAEAKSFKLTTLGRKAAGDWRFFEKLSDPERTFTVRTYDEVVRWFSVQWPTELKWPDGVPRPADKSHLSSVAVQ